MLVDPAAAATEIDVLQITRQSCLDDQQKSLAKLEVVIQKGEAAFFATSKAIIEIIDRQLFSPMYPDKTTYFRNRWDMTPQNVSRFENAGRVLDGLVAEGFQRDQLPKNEAQCRELYRQASTAEDIDLPLMVEIWNAVLSNKKITARLISDVAQEIRTSTASSEEPVERSIDLLNEANPTKPPATQQPVQSEPIRFSKLSLRTSASEINLGSLNAVCEHVGHGQYELTVESSTMRDLLQRLIEWDGIEVIDSLQVAM